jgi:hypothetical protein
MVGGHPQQQHPEAEENLRMQCWACLRKTQAVRQALLNVGHVTVVLVSFTTQQYESQALEKLSSLLPFLFSTCE